MTITNRVSLKSVMAGVTPIDDVPDAPTIGAATNVGTSRAYNNGSATVAYTAAATGGPVTTFTATSTPGSFTGTGTSPITVTGLQSATSYTFTVSAANSNGTLTSAASSSITATTVPQAPTIGTATGEDGSATVPFTAGATGGSAITTFTATSSPESITGTGSSSPITVSGLSSTTAYTFTVTATNANGTSAASAASNSVTPAPISTMVAVGQSASPWVSAYTWTNAGGFGTRYTGPSGVTASGQFVQTHALNTYIAVSSGTNARIYQWSDSTGFGTNTATTSTGNSIYGTNWNTARTAFAIGQSTSTSSQRLAIFAFNNSTGALGTQYSNPASNMNNRANSIKFFQADNVVIAADDANPGVAAYVWSNSTGFGSKWSNPSTVLNGSNNGGDINIQNNTYIASTSGSTSPWVHAYPVSTTAWGSKYANPASTPTDNGNKARFTQSGTIAAFSNGGSSPYVYVYPFNAGFGTKFADPASTMPNTATGVGFSADDKAIVACQSQVGVGATPVHAWVWSNSTGFGSKYANPATITEAGGLDVKFNKVTYQG